MRGGHARAFFLRESPLADTPPPCIFSAGQFAESQGEIKFPEISAKVLEKTVQYFYYKLKHTNHQGALPPFNIEPEHALELLMAANYLDT